MEIQENKRLEAATAAADMATIRMTETDSLNSCWRLGHTTRPNSARTWEKNGRLTAGPFTAEPSSGEGAALDFDWADKIQESGRGSGAPL